MVQASQVQTSLVTPLMWWPLGSAFVLLTQREDVVVGTHRWGGSIATFEVILVWSVHGTV